MEHQIRVDDASQSLEEIWPPFRLRIRSPRLLLRQIREADFPQYVAAATSGVRNSERCPFVASWDDKPPAELVRGSLPWIWSTRDRIGPDRWHLALGVFLPDGTLIGVQDAFARDWPLLRTVSSGSWLRRDHQGRGYGREMRAAMLLWAFDHFGAEFAESGAYVWNAPSRRVSASLGYEEVGRRRVPDAEGKRVEEEILFRLARDELRRPDWEIEVEGSELLRSFFGG